MESQSRESKEAGGAQTHRAESSASTSIHEWRDPHWTPGANRMICLESVPPSLYVGGVSEERKIAKRSPCPNCGKRGLISVVYGLPGAETMKRAHRREVAIGGCIVNGDDPDYRCGNCAAQVYRDGEFEMPAYWDHFDSLLISGGAGE